MDWREAELPEMSIKGNLGAFFFVVIIGWKKKARLSGEVLVWPLVG